MTMTATEPAPLTALDRCDRCGEQAQSRTTLRHGDLLLCGRHYRMHATALEAAAIAPIVVNPEHKF